MNQIPDHVGRGDSDRAEAGVEVVDGQLPEIAEALTLSHEIPGHESFAVVG
ncbi:MAG: hypothetical protein ACR2OU_13535 [Thermomicrobiales bacterium]